MNRSARAKQDKIQILRQRGSFRKQKKNRNSAIPEETDTRSLDDFITKSTRAFFDQLEIKTDSATWDQHEGFKKRLSILNELQVVKDIVKRGVALIEDYNRFMTKNEDQMHFCYKLWCSADNHSLITAKEHCHQEG